MDVARAATAGTGKPMRMWGGAVVTEEEVEAETRAASEWLVETAQRQGFWFPGD